MEILIPIVLLGIGLVSLMAFSCDHSDDPFIPVPKKLNALSEQDENRPS